MKIKALILMVFLVTGQALAVINSEVNRNFYPAGGYVFPFNFRILEADHLRVIATNTTTNQEVLLELTTHYTVSDVGVGAGGSVSLVRNNIFDWMSGDPANLDPNWTLTIRRFVPIIQETDIRNQGPFFPAAHEDAFDYLTMIDQQQQDELNRVMIIAESEDPDLFDTTIPGPLNPNYYIKVNSTGDGFEATPLILLFDSLAPTTTLGDIMAHDGNGNVRVPVGTNDQVLTADDGSVFGVSYKTIDITSVNNGSVGGDGNKLEVKGDIWVFDGLTVSTLPAGASGNIITTISTEPTGLSWLPIGIVSQVLTVSSTGLPYWADSAGGPGGPGDEWSTPITNTVTADTNPPVKGTVVLDEILWKEDGQEYEVIMRYEQSVGSGNAGLGEYIFTLPPGVQIDLAHHVAVTDLPIGNSEVWPKAVIGWGYVASTLASYNAYATVYDTNSFKIQTDSVYPVGHDHMDFGLAPVAFSLRLKFRGVGLLPGSGGGGGGSGIASVKYDLQGIFNTTLERIDGYFVCKQSQTFNTAKLVAFDSGDSGILEVTIRRDGGSGAAIATASLTANGGTNVESNAISLSCAADDYIWVDITGVPAGSVEDLSITLFE